MDAEYAYAAVIETDGDRIICFGPSDYRPYTAEDQAILRWNRSDYFATSIGLLSDRIAGR